MKLLYLFQQLAPVHAGHSHVRHQHIERFAPENIQGLPAAFGKLHLPLRAHIPKNPSQAVEHVWFIIYEKNFLLHPCFHFKLAILL